MVQPLSRMCVQLVLVVGALAATTTAQNADSSQFGAAEQLTAGGKAMTGIYYPSPTLYDIDGEQHKELVIGDLRGRIMVAQPSKGKAGLAWSELEQLQSNKKPLKLNNW